jgi:hypothetical protein
MQSRTSLLVALVTVSVLAAVWGAGTAAAASSSSTLSTTTTTTTTTTTSSSAWNAPTLHDPETILLTRANGHMTLDPHRDYVIECPSGPDNMPSAPVIAGGHNVILDGCNINIARKVGGLEVADQTGTMWIHNLHISGSKLTQGIDLQEPTGTVVMRDVLVDLVHGSYTTNHAELIQSWAGPRRLLIDGFTGSTTYQGFFLLPNQFFRGPQPRIFDFRHVDIDDSMGAYALWRGGSFPLHLQDVYVRPNPQRLWRGWWLWPKPSDVPGSWGAVVAGVPPKGAYVYARRGGAIGLDETVSPAPLRGEQGS